MLETPTWSRMCARVESTRFSDFTTLTCGCFPSNPAAMQFLQYMDGVCYPFNYTHCNAIFNKRDSVLPIQPSCTMQCNFYNILRGCSTHPTQLCNFYFNLQSLYGRQCVTQPTLHFKLKIEVQCAAFKSEHSCAVCFLKYMLSSQPCTSMCCF